jgi:hypothetical protein
MSASQYPVSVDRDMLRAAIERKGCACGIRPCIAHYGLDKPYQTEKLRSDTEQNREEFYVHPGSETRSSQQAGAQRTDPDLRTDQSGDRVRSGAATRGGKSRTRKR